MTARILDGRAVAAQIRDELAGEVASLRARGIVPGLGVLLVGNHPASRSYVTAKERACAEIGMVSKEVHLPESAARREILDAVRAFNEDPLIHGILVQLPLPDPAVQDEVIGTINPDKDVDGFHPVNVGRLVLGLPSYWPCTPHGILQLLYRSGITVAGAHAVVIGRSHIVGRPLSILLSMRHPLGNATVTLCHTGSRDLAEHTRRADIVIAAAGRPGTLTADMVRPGAVVIDVGVNRVEDPSHPRGYRLVGDVDFDSLLHRASAITPVPGGVGPMTIAMLLFNTVKAARRLEGLAPEG
ncbi:MAG: bifunctional 5,10-methylene-tetrahydrofolate dehydrogenase/5,10-methylene-tetrahydrofolate cyclohydrolase [Kiritimatiellae bacterium]|nr:bifunctional 5,10-methylene-tetrahydrofolate dehydrogenase/5,10-methylene-tetrahydrofolate cyclohydrolase [Kiritimatiellia bacterium]MDW8458355.1 tetrahydrofolate dehydrogenase/cyclohydrolase catalytic domain-containing protein [Verrucomicrobiota bacterium]